MITTIVILSILVVILGFTTINLLRKNEKCEDIIVQYDEYISEFNKQIKAADKRLKEIDEKGIFEGDDEIGWFFEKVKEIQEALNEFRLR